MVSVDDFTLLHRFRSDRSDEAFRELVRRHSGPVHAAARRYAGGKESLAEEIAQAVFIEFSRKAPGLTPETVIGGWLQRCVRYKAKEALRAEARRLHRETAAARLAPDPGIPPSRVDLTADLDEALDALPGRDRLPLVMRYYEGRSLKEIGEILGISGDAAQKRIQRSLERLRTELAHRGMTGGSASLAQALAQIFPFPAPSLPAAALQAGTAGSFLSPSLSLLSAMNVKMVSVAILVAAAVAIPLISQQRTIAAQEATIARLEHDVAVGTSTRTRAAGGQEKAARSDAGGTPLKALQEALEEPDSVVRMERFTRLLRGLKTEDAPDLAALLAAKRKSGVLLDDEDNLFLRAWATLDAPAALAFLQENHRDTMDEGAMVMATWATNDQAAAARWLDEHAGAVSDMVTGGFIGGWAHQDLDAATKWALELPESESSGRFAGILFLNCLSNDGLEAAGEWYSRLQPGALRERVANRLAAEMGEAKPAEALDWLMRQDGSGTGERSMTINVIMSAWTEKDLPAAEAWLQQHPDIAEHDDAAQAVAEALRVTDPEASARWKASVKSTPRLLEKP